MPGPWPTCAPSSGASWTRPGARLVEALDGLPRERRHGPIEGGEALVAGLAVQVAFEELLPHHRHLEQPEGAVEAEVHGVAAGERQVARHPLVTREGARKLGRAKAEGLK